ncbi:hypothetical protein AMAG_10071 [Allomyces macrogynus ATCC 38327]|uniref:Uncharacterized protein n=1 Tax=Allomyces macrogynus (strain ATCC 38327) TaxID=578462 RepID=A0A0L0SQD1_ALLM3|nr:hypothetical protein AMAG_10071 [Allomyces macrogynus ATCC 38327]|eukprot:KNE64721.1 hypothetical protein AMAG_10071 [Allomyces macrogynus ATCC 38327]
MNWDTIDEREKRRELDSIRLKEEQRRQADDAKRRRNEERALGKVDAVLRPRSSTPSSTAAAAPASMSSTSSTMDKAAAMGTGRILPSSPTIPPLLPLVPPSSTSSYAPMLGDVISPGPSTSLLSTSSTLIPSTGLDKHDLQRLAARVAFLDQSLAAERDLRVRLESQLLADRLRVDQLTTALAAAHRALQTDVSNLTAHHALVQSTVAHATGRGARDTADQLAALSAQLTHVVADVAALQAAVRAAPEMVATAVARAEAKWRDAAQAQVNDTVAVLQAFQKQVAGVEHGVRATLAAWGEAVLAPVARRIEDERVAWTAAVRAEQVVRDDGDRAVSAQVAAVSRAVEEVERRIKDAVVEPAVAEVAMEVREVDAKVRAEARAWTAKAVALDAKVRSISAEVARVAAENEARAAAMPPPMAAVGQVAPPIAPAPRLRDYFAEAEALAVDAVRAAAGTVPPGATNVSPPRPSKRVTMVLDPMRFEPDDDDAPSSRASSPPPVPAQAPPRPSSSRVRMPALQQPDEDRPPVPADLPITAPPSVASAPFVGPTPTPTAGLVGNDEEDTRWTEEKGD